MTSFVPCLQGYEMEPSLRSQASPFGFLCEPGDSPEFIEMAAYCDAFDWSQDLPAHHRVRKNSKSTPEAEILTMVSRTLEARHWQRGRDPTSYH